MPRGAAAAAQQQLGLERGYGETASNRAGSTWNTLFPEMSQQLINPQGFSPADLTAMNTAAQQGIGGATAGIVGQGALRAARTRNQAAFSPVAAEAARSGQRAMGQSALDIQGMNARAKLAQKAQAASALEGLYGANLKNLSEMMNAGNESILNWIKADIGTNQGLWGNQGLFGGLAGLGQAAANI